MRKTALLILALVLLSNTATSQRKTPPSQTELAEITERGRHLAQYDAAAWYASDAVVATKPTQGTVARYIAKKESDIWSVMFGRLNDRDKFLIAYEATQATTAKEFTVKKHDPPKEDSVFFLFAARAIETALAEFKGEARPYNVAVLPAAAKQLHVYVVPAQTKHGVFPLGADCRYLISTDGLKILEKRQLHKSIIEFSPAPNDNTQAGFHTAVLDDIPEDTDVFHVLSRRPSVPEYIGTKQFVFLIEPDGTIKYLMTTGEFRKKRDP